MKRRTAFTLVELLVVIAIIGILVALLLPAIQAAREAARRTQCTNQIKQVATAMHNYHDTYKKLPAYQYHVSGVNSWQGHGPFTMILPYMEQQPLYDQVDFTRAWDHGNNQNVRRTHLEVLTCPSDLEYPNPTYGGTNYAFCGGARRDFYSTGGPIPSSGMFLRRRESKLGDVLDGTSNTVMIGEILKGDDANGTLSPKRDYTNSLSLPTDEFPTAAEIETAGIACDSTATGWQQSNAGRDWIASFPGQVAFNTIAPPNWQHITCCSGGGFGYACDRNGIVPARSLHPGGVLIALGDASTRFVPDSVELVVWERMGARADGEAVDLP